MYLLGLEEVDEEEEAELSFELGASVAFCCLALRRERFFLFLVELSLLMFSSSICWFVGLLVFFCFVEEGRKEGREEENQIKRRKRNGKTKSMRNPQKFL